jgi:signal transduction histidine kinase
MQFLQDIKKYVGFDAEDVERLRRLRSLVSPHFDELSSHFYDSLLDHDHTRGIFADSDQLANLKDSFDGWLVDIFTGPYNAQYVEHRRHIGRVHVEVGLRPQYMFTAMNLLRVDIIELLCREELAMQLVDAIGSVERILDIDLTLILDGYWDAILAEKAQADTELARGLAHEIRNPLNSIGLNLTVLERKLRKAIDDPSEYESSVRAIRTELDRMEDLTTEIRQYSEPVTADTGWHDLDGLLEEMLSLKRARLSDQSITIEKSVDPPDAKIFCDPDGFKHALKALLTNAAEAIDQQGTVTLESDLRDGYTVLEVTDDGKGMKPTATDRAFDLFYTTKASGTGIGLPIVKKIIEAHGGSIQLLSTSERGTTVRIELPRPEHPAPVE